MHISIEEGKTLIIRLMAIGPLVEGKAQRDVWFEVNGEVFTTFFACLLAPEISVNCRSELWQLMTRVVL